MKTGFIIAEYNPFHLGHAYHIEKTRENGADRVCVIMSGNFVQRGAAAIAEKHLRAECALKNGADLVLEMPLKYALSSADKFALGGVTVAGNTGLDGFLSFGMHGDISALEKIYALKKSVGTDEIHGFMLDNGCTYPVAFSAVMKKHGLTDDETALLTDANNTLALEYISAAKNTDSKLSYIGVERTGAAHDSDEITDGIASASFIRRLITEGGEWQKLMPVSVAEILMNNPAFPVDYNRADVILTSLLAGKTAQDFLETENVNAGLENRLYDAVRNGNNLEEIAFLVKSKRHTLARIRRILVSSALGITRGDISSGVQYIRVLGANETGRKMLHEMKETARLPVISNLSDYKGDDAAVLRDIELDYLAGKLYNLFSDCPVKGNAEYVIPPVFI